MASLARPYQNPSSIIPGSSAVLLRVVLRLQWQDILSSIRQRCVQRVQPGRPTRGRSFARCAHRTLRWTDQITALPVTLPRTDRPVLAGPVKRDFALQSSHWTTMGKFPVSWRTMLETVTWKFRVRALLHVHCVVLSGAPKLVSKKNKNTHRRPKVMVHVHGLRRLRTLMVCRPQLLFDLMCVAVSRLKTWQRQGKAAYEIWSTQILSRNCRRGAACGNNHV